MDTVKWLLILYNIVNFTLGMIVAYRFGLVDKGESRKTAMIVSQALTCGLILWGIISYDGFAFPCFLCLDTIIIVLTYFKTAKKKR